MVRDSPMRVRPALGDWCLAETGRRLIDVDQALQMGSGSAHVCNAHQSGRGKLVLNREVPLLCVRQMGVRIKRKERRAEDSARRWPRKSGRGRTSAREIELTIRESSADQFWGIGSNVHQEQQPRPGIEDSVGCANYRLRTGP